MATNAPIRALTGVEAEVDITSAPTGENAKSRQILDGARDVFRAKGYDGASMEMIARHAGVSKGTLYVYFPNKEELFKALILQERLDQPETCLEIGGPTGDMARDLKQIGHAYLQKMVKPARISTLRMVIGAAEKFPEFGALLYDEGPRKGTEKIARYLDLCIERGDLKPCDTDLAADQFISLCISGSLRRVLLNAGNLPSTEELRDQVDSGVNVFLAAYGNVRD